MFFVFSHINVSTYTRCCMGDNTYYVRCVHTDWVQSSLREFQWVFSTVWTVNS